MQWKGSSEAFFGVLNASYLLLFYFLDAVHGTGPGSRGNGI